MAEEKIELPMRAATHDKQTNIMNTEKVNANVAQGAAQAGQSEPNQTQANEVGTTIIERTASRQEIISRLVKADVNNYVLDTLAYHCHAVSDKTKDGLSKYTKVLLSLKDGVKVYKQADNGDVILQFGSMIQVSQFDILNLLQKDLFYNGIASRVAQDFALDAEMNIDSRDNSNIYMTDDYLRGLPVTIFCQFVNGGEVASNPFARSGEPYEVKAHPRYIYHLVGIGQPTDAECLANIGEIKREVRAERLAKRKELLAAKQAVNRVVANIVNTDDVPF